MNYISEGGLADMLANTLKNLMKRHVEIKKIKQGRSSEIEYHECKTSISKLWFSILTYVSIKLCASGP